MVRTRRPAALLLACGSDSTSGTTSTGSGGSTSATSATGATSAAGTGGTGGSVDPTWTPGTVFPSSRRPNARGLLDLRGLIHAHSVYSHDACDDAPRDPATGAIDQVCFDDFRRGLCQAKHDFAFLTDHDTSFSETEFPEVLLYRSERGDRLAYRNGAPVASWASCDDGNAALVLAGCEAATMPVGLERHAGSSKDERSAVYASATPENVAALKALGAVSLVAHTEDWTPDELIALGVDGFEMYNLHANLELNLGAGIELFAEADDVRTPPTQVQASLAAADLKNSRPRTKRRLRKKLRGASIATRGVASSSAQRSVSAASSPAPLRYPPSAWRFCPPCWVSSGARSTSDP